MRGGVCHWKNVLAKKIILMFSLFLGQGAANSKFSYSVSKEKSEVEFMQYCFLPIITL